VAAQSKFTAERRQIIVEHLAAGFSRRGAARAAQIDHETLSRWLKRGAKGAPDGRWRTFFDAVTLAETPSEPTILVAL
jgi:DNA invertase Pin-like site-specific DNA recombinase